MTVIRHIEIKNVYKIVSHGQKINIGIGGFYDNQCLSVCLLPDDSIYYFSKLLVPVVFFAELVWTGLWASWVEHIRFLPRPARNESNGPKLYTLQMFTGIYRVSIRKSECGDFKFMGLHVSCNPCNFWIPMLWFPL